MNLNKDICGLKQDSKSFYDFMKEHLIREMKFQKCLSYSCLLKMNKIQYGLVYMLMTSFWLEMIILLKKLLKNYHVGLISLQRKVWMNMSDVSWSQEIMFCLSIRDAFL